MKPFPLGIFLLLITKLSYGQLDKGHWLVGGSGRFYSYKNEVSGSFTSQGKVTQIDLSPNVGYFLADKFALGMRTTISSTEGSFNFPSGTGGTRNRRYIFGLFSRYYLLNIENRTNILVDASYQRGIFRGFDTKGTLNNFSIAAGPVIYLNSSVGLEFLLAYVIENQKYISEVLSERKNGIQFSIGLQIHLEKN